MPGDIDPQRGPLGQRMRQGPQAGCGRLIDVCAAGCEVDAVEPFTIAAENGSEERERCGNRFGDQIDEHLQHEPTHRKLWVIE